MTNKRQTVTAELALECRDGGFWVLAGMGFDANVSVAVFPVDLSGDCAVFMPGDKSIEEGN